MEWLLKITPGTPDEPLESSFEELFNNTAGRLRLVLSIWCWVSQPSWCLCNRKVADHGEEYNTITITWFSRLNFLWCSSREKQVDSRMVGIVSRNYIADNRLLQDSIPSKIGMVEGTWGEDEDTVWQENLIPPHYLLGYASASRQVGSGLLSRGHRSAGSSL